MDWAQRLKAAAFDLEIARAFPNGGDWKKNAPLGITCAALAFSDRQAVMLWQDTPQLTRAEAQVIVAELQRVVGEGYTLVTWNGCAFDLAVLAQESDMPDACAELALTHVDLMLIVTFMQGHYLGLQKALEGASLEGKIKSVILSDGTILNEMSGALAPRLWAEGERQAVLTYLTEDVLQLLKLADVIQESKLLKWKSKDGRLKSLTVPQLLKVQDCFKLPNPDTSWMQNPPRRAEFVEWMPPASHKLLRERSDYAYIIPGSYWSSLVQRLERFLKSR